MEELVRQISDFANGRLRADTLRIALEHMIQANIVIQDECGKWIYHGEKTQKPTLHNGIAKAMLTIKKFLEESSTHQVSKS